MKLFTYLSTLRADVRGVSFTPDFSSAIIAHIFLFVNLNFWNLDSLGGFMYFMGSVILPKNVKNIYETFISLADIYYSSVNQNKEGFTKCECVDSDVFYGIINEIITQEGFDYLFNKLGAATWANNYLHWLFSFSSSSEQNMIDVNDKSDQLKISIINDEFYFKMVKDRYKKTGKSKGCKTCGGTGFLSYYYNPNHLYDYYSVGRRFAFFREQLPNCNNHIILSKNSKTDGLEAIDKMLKEMREGVKIEENAVAQYMSTCEKVLKEGDYFPRAIILPNGEWVDFEDEQFDTHEERAAGGDGIERFYCGPHYARVFVDEVKKAKQGLESDYKDDMIMWYDYVRDLLNKYTDHYIIPFDCHI